MKKYILIKDELYTSTFHSNIENFLDSEGVKCNFSGSEKYRIKLMMKKDAQSLLNNHPLLLDAKHKESKNEIISLVSFGGQVYDIPLQKMLKIAEKDGAVVLASEAVGTSEAEILSKTKTYDTKQLKKATGKSLFIYLTLLNLKGTDLYYLITNPTLVQCVGHIEEHEEYHLEQVRNKFGTLKDSIFGVRTTPEPIGPSIFSGGLCTIELLKNGMIEPEDRETFFGQLEFKIDYGPDAAHSFASSGETGLIALAHQWTTPLRITIMNKLIDNYIKKEEELKWEYIILKKDSNEKDL